MIKITLEFPNANEAMDVLTYVRDRNATTVAKAETPKSVLGQKDASGPAIAKAAAPSQTAAASAPVAVSVANAAQASTAATPESKKPDAAVSQPKATAAASSASEAGAITYDQVKTLILRVSKDKGGDAARAVLAGLGVSKGPELKPEQYKAAVEACEAALS